jgi:hypothetical protein
VLALSTNPLLKSAASNQDTPDQLKKAHTLKRKAAKRDAQHALDIANAANELGEIPGPEESLHCVMRGNFHGWDLVPAILRLADPATIDCLYVATLGFNKQNAAELLELFDRGQIAKVVFVCSVYFQQSCPGEFEMLHNGLRSRGQTIIAVRSHAKILGVALSDGRRLAVESSANLRSCRNIEQFCFTNSAAPYRFHAEWIDQITQAVGQQAEPAKPCQAAKKPPPAKARAKKKRSP